jgi:hypothetical protein
MTVLIKSQFSFYIKNDLKIVPVFKTTLNKVSFLESDVKVVPFSEKQPSMKVVSTGKGCIHYLK